jgi:hypothetical protein
MTTTQLDTIIDLLDPPKGRRLWYGGATAHGALRGISPEAAAWKSSPERLCIWELTLHIAYWKYAVRRLLDGSPKGGFPRQPSNWPAVPARPNSDSWKKDRALLLSEHRTLVVCARTFEEKRLSEYAPGSKTWTFADLLYGVVTHDVYHVGQIQLLKRLFADARRRSNS